MDFKSDIKKILKSAVYAPSGDNSQPWRFEVKNNVLNIFSLPERDNPLFNFHQRGTLIAHGALLENILILSKSFGYGVEVQELPDNAVLEHTYRLTFKEINPINQPLAEFIEKRQTNRKLFKKVSLLPKHRDALIEAGKMVESQEFLLVEDQEKINIIGKAVGANEIVMLEHKELHDMFYADVRWTTKSERKFKTGLYLKTMELPFPKLVFFKILQWWPVAKIFNKFFGMARFIAKDNAKQYSSASAIGIILVPDKDSEFLKAGRLTQRIWLTATQNNISIHPVTGIIYLAQRVKSGETETLSQEHVKIIKDAYENITNTIGRQDGCLAMLFRIGYSDPPGGASSRLDPEIKYK